MSVLCCLQILQLDISLLQIKEDKEKLSEEFNAQKVSFI